MLKSLSVLPKEVKDVIAELVSLPECMKFIDRASYDEYGLHGGLYVVMRGGTKLWDRKYRRLEDSVMEFLSKDDEEVWDRTEGVSCTSEDEPMGFRDIDDYVEGVDYVVISKEKVLEEVMQ